MSPMVIASAGHVGLEARLQASAARLGLDGWRERSTWTARDGSAHVIVVGSALTGRVTPRPSVFASDSSGSWDVMFDGRIFNRVELLQRLQRHLKGGSLTDAGLVAVAVGVWGLVKAQEHINGDWVLAASHLPTGDLFVSCDRFGSQAAFYARDPASRLVVSSHLMALQPFGFSEPDAAALVFSNYLLETTERTILRGVSSVPPGGFVRLNVAERPVLNRWWRTVDHVPDIPVLRPAVIGELRELLLDSVSLRVPDRDAFSTSVSGGLDSSVVAVAIDYALRDRGESPARQRLHHQGFADSSQDERSWADALATHVGLPVRDTAVSPRAALPDLATAIAAFEADHYMPLALWEHYRQIADAGLTTSFEGLGADSLFAGSTKSIAVVRQSALRRGRGRDWLRYAEAVVVPQDGRRQGYRLGQNVSLLGTDLAAMFGPQVLLAELRDRRTQKGAFARVLKAVSRRRRGSLVPTSFGTDVEEVAALIHARRKQLWAESRDLNELNRRLYLTTHMTSLPTEIRNFNRIANWHGVTTVNPFLDWRVAAFAFALPEDAKVGASWSKRILREAFAPMLPDAVAWRRDKLGFTAPMLDWIKGGLREVMVAEAAKGFALSSADESERLRRSVMDADGRGDIGSLKREWPYVQRSLLLSRLTGE